MRALPLPFWFIGNMYTKKFHRGGSGLTQMGWKICSDFFPLFPDKKLLKTLIAIFPDAVNLTIYHAEEELRIQMEEIEDEIFN